MNHETPISSIDLAALAAYLPHPVPWPECLAEILPGLSRPIVTKAHEAKVREVVREIEAMSPPPATTADLTVAFVSRYVQSRPSHWSPYTLKSHLQIVSTLCKRAFERRWLAVSPFTPVPMSRWVRLGPPRGKRHLSREEIRRLLELLRADIDARKGWHQWKGRRLYAVACIGLYCGLRRTELLMLHMEDVDIPARVIRVRPHQHRQAGGRLKSKSSAKPVGIPEALVPILEDWLAHRLDAPAGFPMPESVPWVIPTCSRRAPWIGGNKSRAVVRLQAAARRAGIEHVTLHMLRRSLATHLEGHGLGGAMISRIMRHSGQQVTETYYRQADERQVADAVRDLVF
jgi:integrase